MKTITKQQANPSDNTRGFLFERLLVFISTLPIYLPLFKSSFFWSHENAYFLWRAASFHFNVQAGMPCCRWFPDFARGLGLPFLEFYPVLPLYITEVFTISGVPLISAVKLTIIVITLFAAAGAWKLGHAIWGRCGGVLVSVLYSYAPYKMVNLYVRGDINELMAMASLPWALWVVYSIARKKDFQLVSLTAPAIFAIPALTHYPSCVIQYPIIFIWILGLTPLAGKPIRFLLRHCIALSGALLMTSTFWVSAFMSRHLVQMEGMTQGFADYTKHFIELKQFFSFYWNFGASVLGPGDAISFQLGNIAILFTLLGVGIIFKKLKRINRESIVLYLAFGLTVIPVILMHQVSSVIWSNIPILPMLQFPYRLLVIPALMLSITGGATGQHLERLTPRNRNLTLLVLVIVIIGSSWYMCRVATYLNITNSDLDPSDIQLAAHTHCTGEYIPKPVGKRFPPPKPVTFTLEKIPEDGFSREQTEKRLQRWLESAPDPEKWEGGDILLGKTFVKPGKLEIVSGNLEVLGKTGPLINRSWEIHARSAGIVRINQFYFEGWSARLDKQSVPVQPDSQTGLILVDIPEGQHKLHLKYVNLPISRFLSLPGVLCLVILVSLRIFLRKNGSAKR